MNSIDFAKKYMNISEDELNIILANRKSMIINNDNMWEKNQTDNFNVAMGSFDSAQIADLIGIYKYCKEKFKLKRYRLIERS